MLNAQMRWTSSFDKIIAFLEIGENGGEVSCKSCAREGRNLEGAVPVHVSAPWRASVRCALWYLNLLKPLTYITDTSQSQLTAGESTGRNDETERFIFFFVGALFSGAEMLSLLKSLLWLQLREKRMNIFSVESKQDKRLSALYLYSYCTTFL